MKPPMKEAMDAIQERVARLAQAAGARTSNCPHCDGWGVGYFPHSDPFRASLGHMELQDCPYCNPSTVCPTCGGLGSIKLNVPPDHPAFGQVYPCPENCAAVQRDQSERHDRLRRVSQLPLEYQRCTFDFWDSIPEPYKAGKKDARRAAELFVEAVDRGCMIEAGYFSVIPSHIDPNTERNWLIFSGPYGTGKTGMAASVVNALTDAGRVSLYIRLQDLFAAIQRRYERERQSELDDDGFGELTSAQVLEDIKTAPILIIDEWFREPVSADKRDKLEAIMRHRAAAVLPTIITTNYTLDELESAWGTTTLSVVRSRSFVIPVGGLVLRDAEINVGGKR